MTQLPNKVLLQLVLLLYKYQTSDSLGSSARLESLSNSGSNSRGKAAANLQGHTFQTRVVVASLVTVTQQAGHAQNAFLLFFFLDYSHKSRF
jgi:hypothetical protein